MKVIYQAYCRSVTRMQCTPWVTVIAVFLLLALVIGADRFIAQHLQQIRTAGKDAAAVALCVIAARLLVVTARVVAAARGTHYAYHLRTVPATAPRGSIIGERADGSPATTLVPVSRPGEPAFTCTLKPAEAAAMNADALRDGDMEPVVSTRGNLFALNDAEAADAP
jgi:hypothetical protein